MLRGSEQSLLRSVHSEFESLAIEPRNKYRWSFRRGVHGNNIPRLIIGQRQQSNRGRQNKADEQSRTCGNLGDPAISTVVQERESFSRLYVREAGDKNKSYRTWYRQAKETKQSERNRRKSECLDSTNEVGELYNPEESMEGSEASEF